MLWAISNLPSGAEAQDFSGFFVARLKSCPFTTHFSCGVELHAIARDMPACPAKQGMYPATIYTANSDGQSGRIFHLRNHEARHTLLNNFPVLNTEKH
jgi:hypothetical protein